MFDVSAPVNSGLGVLLGWRGGPATVLVDQRDFGSTGAHALHISAAAGAAGEVQGLTLAQVLEALPRGVSAAVQSLVSAADSAPVTLTVSTLRLLNAHGTIAFVQGLHGASARLLGSGGATAGCGSSSVIWWWGLWGALRQRSGKSGLS